MKLVLITPPKFFVEEDQIITSLFEEGLDILHLRKPGSAPMYSERLLTLIPKQYHKRIVTHDHFYLKEEYNLMGIHLNSRNPDVPLNYKGHVSCSCHSLEEVKQKKGHFNYVFMSPVFDSVSKKEYLSNFTPEELKEASKHGIIDKRVIALGGITTDNIRTIKKYGFGGAAILGDIWDRFDEHDTINFAEVLQRFKQLKKLAD
jgi:thiamine-phosphate pyrophosphorylase